MAHRHSAILLLAVATLILAGCTQAIEETPGETDDPPVTNAPTPPTQPVPPTELPNSMYMTECQGFGTRFEWPLHRGHVPEPPPEWQDPDAPYTSIVIQFLDCERFSLGHFERPVQLLWEWYGNHEPPDDCIRQNSTHIHYLLSAVYTNDTEVAEYLNQTLGITTYVASFEYRREENEVLGRELVWTMTHGGRQSELRTSETDDVSEPPGFDNRIYWFPPWGGVAWMNWDVQKYQVERIGRYTYGHIEAPLLAAGWPTDYAGVGSTNFNTHAGGDLGFYQDLLCNEPSS